MLICGDHHFAILSSYCYFVKKNNLCAIPIYVSCVNDIHVIYEKYPVLKSGSQFLCTSHLKVRINLEISGGELVVPIPEISLNLFAAQIFTLQSYSTPFFLTVSTVPATNDDKFVAD